MDLAFPHVLILLLVLGALALFIGALISVGRSSASGTEKAVWVLITLMFPLVGPIAWFAIGRPRPSSPSTGGRQTGAQGGAG